MTKEAILAAAEHVFSRRGFDGVSVRDIGERAGVSHALVHRYFGTKDDLYKTVLARNENAVRDAADGVDDLTRAAALMLRDALTHRQPYLRLIVDSALRGAPFDSSDVRFSGLERLIELVPSAGRDEESAATGDEETSVIAGVEADRRLAIVMVVSLVLGWASAGQWVVGAAGLQNLDEERLTAAFERAVTILLEGWLSAPVAAAGDAEQRET